MASCYLQLRSICFYITGFMHFAYHTLTIYHSTSSNIVTFALICNQTYYLLRVQLR